MKQLAYTVTLLIIFLSLNLGCKKGNTEKTIASIQAAVGTINYTGSTTADGCDWVIIINSIYYHPDRLEDQYKLDKAKITISYDLLNDKYHCGSATTSPGMDVIHITKITVN